MLYYYLLFFFVAVGAKFILAMITIYLLLPSDRRCNRCDAETLLLRPSRTGRLALAVFLGRAQWRWCPRCDWHGLGRAGRAPLPGSGMPVDEKATTRNRPLRPS